MVDSRRDFMKKAAAAAAPVTAISGCMTSKQEGIETLYIEADPEELHTDVDGQDLYANIMAYAEDESLKELRMEYREPGEKTWNILDERKTDEEKLHIQESFHTDMEGSYSFRSVAQTDQEEYISEVKQVEFL